MPGGATSSPRRSDSSSLSPRTDPFFPNLIEIKEKIWEKDFVLYACANNETCRIIAKRYGGPAKDIVDDNVEMYPGLTQSSKLIKGTGIYLRKANRVFRVDKKKSKCKKRVHRTSSGFLPSAKRRKNGMKKKRNVKAGSAMSSEKKEVASIKLKSTLSPRRRRETKKDKKKMQKIVVKQIGILPGAVVKTRKDFSEKLCRSPKTNKESRKESTVNKNPEQKSNSMKISNSPQEIQTANDEETETETETDTDTDTEDEIQVTEKTNSTSSFRKRRSQREKRERTILIGSQPVLISSLQGSDRSSNLAAATALKERIEVGEKSKEAKSKKRKRKEKSEETRKSAVPSEYTLNLTRRKKMNNAMKITINDSLYRRKIFLSFHFDALEPFLSKGVRAKIRKCSEKESTEFMKSVVSVDADPLRLQPKTIGSDTLRMRPYQLKGLEWMLHMFDCGMHPILGDEMGLGKTLQTISLLSALKHERKLPGINLIVVPLSVISSWLSEFRKWCPTLRIMRFHATDATERERLKRELLTNPENLDVVLTTYETVKSKDMIRVFSGGIVWLSLVLDEAHRVKNEGSQISQALVKVHARVKVLLTGTPIQNNLHELWALLYFLYPNVFPRESASLFDHAFDLNKAVCSQSKSGSNQILIDRGLLEKAHFLMRPFMLQRRKTDIQNKLPPRIETRIMCPLSNVQRFWYQRLLLKEAEQLKKVDNTKMGSNWKKLRSLLMQLRKCCNHPYLFPNAEAAMIEAIKLRRRTDSKKNITLEEEIDEAIITASGKMQNLDNLLRLLLAKKHRVVIFSQFTSFLDIVDDYLNLQKISFVRLDGSVNRVRRMIDIAEFNKPNSPYNVFLMSTRAGGLGVNLQTADTVILLDSDWNPQVDQQAMARVHRIGQKKVVHIYRFVAKNTVEERLIQRAEKKLFLDTMVNRGGTIVSRSFCNTGTSEEEEKDFLSALSFGVDRISEQTKLLTDDEILRIIDRTNTTETSEEKRVSDSVKSTSNVESNSSSTFSVRGKSTLANFDETVSLLALRNFEGKYYSRDGTVTEVSDKGKGKGKKVSMKSIANEWLALMGGGAIQTEEDSQSLNCEKDSSVITEKRKRKLRVIKVGHHQVLKSNMYNMEGGEPSVFEREYNEKGKKKNSKRENAREMAAQMARTTTRQIAGRDFDHDDFCLICLDGGTLVLCDHCPAAYHLECLGLTEIDPQMEKNWSCPHHRCEKCNKSAYAVGGLLFRCEMCPRAFCEDHIPRDMNIVNECKRFQELGQRTPDQACFVRCSKDCIQRAQHYYNETPDSTVVGHSLYVNDGKNTNLTIPRVLSGKGIPQNHINHTERKKESDWERLTYACSLPPECIRLGLGLALESWDGMEPLPLSSFPGFPQRLKNAGKTNAVLVHSLHWLLFLQDVDEGDVDDATEEDVSAQRAVSAILKWSGAKIGNGDIPQLGDKMLEEGENEKKTVYFNELEEVMKAKRLVVEKTKTERNLLEVKRSKALFECQMILQDAEEKRINLENAKCVLERSSALRNRMLREYNRCLKQSNVPISGRNRFVRNTCWNCGHVCSMNDGRLSSSCPSCFVEVKNESILSLLVANIAYRAAEAAKMAEKAAFWAVEYAKMTKHDTAALRNFTSCFNLYNSAYISLKNKKFDVDEIRKKKKELLHLEEQSKMEYNEHKKKWEKYCFQRHRRKAQIYRKNVAAALFLRLVRTLSSWKKGRLEQLLELLGVLVWKPSKKKTRRSLTNTFFGTQDLEKLILKPGNCYRFSRNALAELAAIMLSVPSVKGLNYNLARLMKKKKKSTITLKTLRDIDDEATRRRGGRKIFNNLVKPGKAKSSEELLGEAVNEELEEEGLSMTELCNRLTANFYKLETSIVWKRDHLRDWLKGRERNKIETLLAGDAAVSWLYTKRCIWSGWKEDPKNTLANVALLGAHRLKAMIYGMDSTVKTIDENVENLLTFHRNNCDTLVRKHDEEMNHRNAILKRNHGIVKRKLYQLNWTIENLDQPIIGDCGTNNGVEEEDARIAFDENEKRGAEIQSKKRWISPCGLFTMPFDEEKYYLTNAAFDMASMIEKISKLMHALKMRQE
eukprot:g145.t1